MNQPVAGIELIIHLIARYSQNVGIDESFQVPIAGFLAALLKGIGFKIVFNGAVLVDIDHVLIKNIVAVTVKEVTAHLRGSDQRQVRFLVAVPICHNSLECGRQFVPCGRDLVDTVLLEQIGTNQTLMVKRTLHPEGRDPVLFAAHLAGFDGKLRAIGNDILAVFGENIGQVGQRIAGGIVCNGDPIVHNREHIKVVTGGKHQVDLLIPHVPCKILELQLDTDTVGGQFFVDGLHTAGKLGRLVTRQNVGQFCGFAAVRSSGGSIVFGSISGRGGSGAAASGKKSRCQHTGQEHGKESLHFLHFLCLLFNKNFIYSCGMPALQSKCGQPHQSVRNRTDLQKIFNP